MMRITTNGVFRGYRTDLSKSYFKFSKSMTKVTTQRNFNAYAEDVSAASRAFQLRRSHWRAETQINNSNYVVSKFETAWSAIDYIVDGEGAEDNLNSIVESLRGLNDAAGSARNALGQSVLAKAESIVRLLNTQYGDQFIFAGADGRNVPFTWEKDPSTGETYLAYRGVDVSAPRPIMSLEEFKSHIKLTSSQEVNYDPEEQGNPPRTYSCWKFDFDDGLLAQGFTLDAADAGVFFNYHEGEEVDEAQHMYASEEEAYEAARTAYQSFLDDEDAITAAYNEYLRQFDANVEYQKYTHDSGLSPSAYYQQLVDMSQEATYVDIGIGVEWDENGDLIPTSAYNSALNGLSFLGFGSTIGDDGELRSNNLAVLMMEMGNMLKDCDSTTGKWPEGWDTDRVSALTKAIESSVNDITVEHIRLSNETNFLQTNLIQLTAQRDNLNTQILDIEQIDPADAITEYMYARYAYNAALSVGSSILTNTLLDYLR